MNRLLNKTLLYYSFFATIILLLSAPFFYRLMEKLYLDDVDEAILLRQREFAINNESTLAITDIPVWNRFNRDTRIFPDTLATKPKDSIVQEFFFDTLVTELEPYRVLYTPVSIQQKNFVLMTRLNLVESEDLIRTLAWLYACVLLALMVVIFFVTRFISNKLWSPFYSTLKQIERFNIEQHSLPDFRSTNTKEFQQLNVGLEKLILANLQSYQSQKVFTQNAAHELQTPLAVFQSKLDLLLQVSSLTQTQATILQTLYDASSRLTRITKNLLLLAKIENKQFADLANFSIDRLIEEVIPYFSEQAAGKHIQITTLNVSPIAVSANRGLAEIMLNNLLLNAIRHNMDGGEILVDVCANKLMIRNTGHAEALDTGTVFKRFGKVSSNAYSSGLGLAIVKEICDRYAWKIDYQFINNMHEFAIIF